MLADLVMVAWIYLCVRAGLWVNNLVLQLDALAQGVINAGKTFDSWILSFEQGIPNSVPYLSDFLHRTADALKVHSGDSLISAGQAGSRGIHLLALILAIIVTSVPLVFALAIFLPRRLRLIADMRGIHVTVRRALAQPEPTGHRRGAPHSRRGGADAGHHRADGSVPEGPLPGRGCRARREYEDLRRGPSGVRGLAQPAARASARGFRGAADVRRLGALRRTRPVGPAGHQ